MFTNLDTYTSIGRLFNLKFPILFAVVVISKTLPVVNRDCVLSNVWFSSVSVS